jgi:hypothetical protein
LPVFLFWNFYLSAPSLLTFILTSASFLILLRTPVCSQFCLNISSCPRLCPKIGYACGQDSMNLQNSKPAFRPSDSFVSDTPSSHHPEFDSQTEKW